MVGPTDLVVESGSVRAKMVLAQAETAILYLEDPLSLEKKEKREEIVGKYFGADSPAQEEAVMGKICEQNMLKWRDEWTK